MTGGTVSEGRPLRSEFADDPDMRDIVQLFVEEMPGRVAQLQGAWERHDLETLRRLTHQLKGSGGGYGFSPLSDSAGRIEELVNDIVAGSAAPDMGRLQREMSSLLTLCRSVAT